MHRLVSSFPGVTQSGTFRPGTLRRLGTAR
jgi:hypothetical protein